MKCAFSVTRETLMAVAIPYARMETQRLRLYRSATTVATENAAAAWPEGKLLPLKGDLPPLKNVLVKGWPGGMSDGRWRRVTAFRAKSTMALVRGGKEEEDR